MFHRILITPILLLPLSGCFLIDVNTRSGFFVPQSSSAKPSGYTGIEADGAITNPGLGDTSGSTTYGGVRYFTTLNDLGAGAYAGVIAGSDVGDVLTSGEAVYLADYEVASLTNLRYQDIDGDGRSTLVGVSGVDKGDIILTADFGTNKLTGADGSLVVDGDISGGRFGGSVTYAGLDGDLQGIVGKVGVIGAFHANSGEMVYSGGFADYTED